MTPTSLADLQICFEGAVPAVVATASADGTPNVTYLSCVRMIDAERVALSNQFFSKTVRNLAENPRASLLLIDPTTYDQYRLTVVYERTERHGPVFDRLREDVDAVAALEGMEDVFKLRAADIYRVTGVEQVLAAVHKAAGPESTSARTDASRALPDAERLAALTARLSRCTGLDTLVDTTVTGLDDLLGYRFSLLLLLDETGQRLFTIASHGYTAEGVGSEVRVGQGIIGSAARSCTPLRIGNARQLAKYSRSVRRSFEEHGDLGPGDEIPIPGLADASSRLAVPALALGQLVGVLSVESTEPVAFTAADEAALSVVATVVAQAIEIDRIGNADIAAEAGRRRSTDTVPAPIPTADTTHVRFFPTDGSTFIDGDYLIKGVAGRILWSLLGAYESEGRVDFTNREMRLDPSLELPELRDNFESRLILLKRRLDERSAPIRIEKTGRGRFRLVVDAPVYLDCAGAAGD